MERVFCLMNGNSCINPVAGLLMLIIIRRSIKRTVTAGSVKPLWAFSQHAAKIAGIIQYSPE